jgi:GntR family transcriptional regulator
MGAAGEHRRGARRGRAGSPCAAQTPAEGTPRGMALPASGVYNATNRQCDNGVSMPGLRIDLRSKTPVYRQVAEGLGREIAAGSRPPGSRLPTVRELGAELRVNFNTVARAYRILDAAGLVSMQQGRGTYVLAPAGPRTKQQLRRQALRELVGAFVYEAERLGARPEAVEALVLRRLRRWKSQGARPEGSRRGM